MTRKEFWDKLSVVRPDDKKVSEIEELYQCSLSNEIMRMISFPDETVFLDSDCRLLPFEEIVDASDDLHVDFIEMGLLPLLDCGDNNFVVYHTKKDCWSYFNIVDESIFKQRPSLTELLG